MALRVYIMVISRAEPSVMAASTTWPRPEPRASSSAASTPTTSSIAPPPQSATRLGHHRLAAGLADGVQRAGQRQVVDVVAGGGGQRAGLAPAGHAARRGAGWRPGSRRAQAEALHHAGAVAFDEAVGRGDQLAGGGEAFGLLEVEGDDAAVAVEDVDRRIKKLGRRLGARRQLALDAHHLGAQVGEDHRPIGAGPRAANSMILMP
jgi:hypothetical protein